MIPEHILIASYVKLVLAGLRVLEPDGTDTKVVPLHLVEKVRIEIEKQVAQ